MNPFRKKVVVAKAEPDLIEKAEVEKMAHTLRVEKAAQEMVKLSKAARKRELTVFAKSIFGDATENLSYLVSLDRLLPDDVFEEVVDRELEFSKSLDDSPLLSEFGKCVSEPGGNQLEVLLKSGDVDMEALNKLMSTEEGKRLYAEYTRETNKTLQKEGV
ncbi:hypothetical protein LCGC14_2485430 [marine sediment metagenome]|uniref:Uncharacterized protein n=1 Tax=marine sediment metagenome TaxID=412755 RepID=A0A0F9B733_9ZZZZ